MSDIIHSMMAQLGSDGSDGSNVFCHFGAQSGCAKKLVLFGPQPQELQYAPQRLIPPTNAKSSSSVLFAHCVGRNVSDFHDPAL